MLLLAASARALLAPLRRLGLKKPPAPSIVFDDDDYDDEESVWCPLDECEIPPEASSLESSLRRDRGLLGKAWKRVGRAWQGRGRKPPGKLVLIRHGQSTWNANKTFTGWVDVDLSPIGEAEMEHAARLMLERGLQADVVYTSVLKRAIRSAWILLAELGQTYRPVVKDWRLNERHYGALQGRSKVGLVDVLSPAVVQSFRAGYATRPPELPDAHALSATRERKYVGLPRGDLPRAESLEECLERVVPVFQERILQDLDEGLDVVVVAHGNSLRGLVKNIDGLDDSVIERVGIPNGIPLVYEFDRDDSGTLIPVETMDKTQTDLSGEFLEERGLLREAIALERKALLEPPSWAPSSQDAVSSTLEQGLETLARERRVMAYAQLGTNLPLVDPVPLLAQAPIKVVPSVVPDADARGGVVEARPTQPQAGPMASRERPRRRRSVKPPTPGKQRPPLVILIRHGQTTHNKLGLFTGWEDAPLSPEGRAEASRAGALLAAHGVEVDAVYTSWLTRAITTAWLVLAPLDSLWVSIHKSWRLNERMYGALTGLSKKMIAQRHGEAQFRKWRRGFAERPPPASPFSSKYPGNDERYVKYVHDLPISLRQSFIRSLGHGKIELHHKLPRTESLKDCLQRTIPYYKDTILPQTVAQNRTVLISSSENAIRGLLMDLCDVPRDVISDIEIPTGVPLVYDLESRCLHLFDDGILPKPRDRYDFGAAADVIFRPCDDEEGCPLDPHLYLDDAFCEDSELDRYETEAAEREAWQRVLNLDDEEFTTHMSSFYRPPVAADATRWDDEPLEIEI